MPECKGLGIFGIVNSFGIAVVEDQLWYGIQDTGMCVLLSHRPSAYTRNTTRQLLTTDIAK